MKALVLWFFIGISITAAGQLDYSRTDILKRKGPPGKESSSEEGIPFVLYWEPTADSLCGIFDNAVAYYFDEHSICNYVRTMQPVCMKPSWQTYFNKKYLKVSDYKWRDYSNNIEFSIKETSELVVVSITHITGMVNSTDTLIRTQSIVEISLNESGVYEVPAEVNRVLKINFILDSGASDVSISPDVALTLIRTKTVQASDFIGSKTYRFADGSTAESSVFIIRELKIGGKVLKNVRATISDSIDAPMLLGQSVLQRFGKLTIDNEAQILTIE